LRDQVRAYRGIYERYHSDPINVSFNDVITTQQTTAQMYLQYMDTLADQWQAVVGIAELLQVDDVLQMGEAVDIAPLPELNAVGPEAVLPPP
jgi:hypothetical protein